jgi:hypothetical protein
VRPGAQLGAVVPAPCPLPSLAAEAQTLRTAGGDDALCFVFWLGDIATRATGSGRSAERRNKRTEQTPHAALGAVRD